MVLAEFVMASCIAFTKFPPGRKSHACTTVEWQTKTLKVWQQKGEPEDILDATGLKLGEKEKLIEVERVERTYEGMALKVWQPLDFWMNSRDSTPQKTKDG